MSQQAIDAILRAFDAMTRGDLEAAVANLDRSIEWYPPAEVIPAPPVVRGREEVRQRLTQLTELWEDLRLEADEVIDGAPIFIAVRQTARGTGSGAPVEARWFQVVTERAGVPIRIDNFLDRTHALEAAGLPGDA